MIRRNQEVASVSESFQGLRHEIPLLLCAKAFPDKVIAVTPLCPQGVEFEAKDVHLTPH